jgi:hypothetical protein
LTSVRYCAILCRVCPSSSSRKFRLSNHSRAFRTAFTLRPLPSNFCIFCLLRTLCTPLRPRMSRKPCGIKMIRTLARTTEGVPPKKQTSDEGCLFCLPRSSRGATIGSRQACFPHALCTLPLSDRPLLSTTSKLLFRQLLSFDIYTNCPPGVGVRKANTWRNQASLVLDTQHPPPRPKRIIAKSDELTHMESHSYAKPPGEGSESLNVPTFQPSNVLTSSALLLYFLTSLLLSFSHA